MTTRIGQARRPSPTLARRRLTPVAQPPAAPPAPLYAPERGFGARLADWLADRLLGAEVPAYRGQLPGAAGRLANRLAKGESAVLSATATATVPAALLATWLPAGNLLPDLGGTLRVAGMLARKNDGKLLLTLTFQGAEGASTATGGGLSAGLTLGDRRYGFKLGAEQAVGGELSQLVVTTMKFDPAKPADVQRLAALLTPGWAFDYVPAFQAAMRENRVGLSVGGVLGASLGATIGATVGELDPTDGQGVAADSSWTVKAKLALTGSASGELFRTWEKDGAVTDMVGFELGVEGGLKLPTILKGKLTDRMAQAFNVTRDKDGKVTALSAVFTDAVGARLVADRPQVDVGGRVTTKVVRTRALNEAGLAAARRALDAGANPLTAYADAARDPANVEETVVTVAGRQLAAGIDGGLSVGGHRVGLVGLFAGGKMKRHASDDGDPGLRELLAVLKGSGGRPLL